MRSAPDSPSDLSWMRLSPPVSPRFVPIAAADRRNNEDVDGGDSQEDTPDLLGPEAGHASGRLDGPQNYWKGRGTRRRTSSGDSNNPTSLED